MATLDDDRKFSPTGESVDIPQAHVGFSDLPPVDSQLEANLRQYEAARAVERARQEEIRRRRRTEHFAAKEGALEFLREIADRINAEPRGLSGALLEAHQPGPDGHYFACQGCSYDDDYGHMVDWPCETVKIVCKYSGIVIPENFGYYDPQLDKEASDE
jgi:hypothetical protein